MSFLSYNYAWFSRFSCRFTSGCLLRPKKTYKKKEFTDFTEADEWGEKHDKRWVDNLSVSEREAVTEYTGTRYKNINAVFRGKESAYTGRNAEIAENISNALKKANVPEDLVVYRGASKRALGEFKNSLKEDMVGKVIEDKGFMSTSMLEKSSFKGDVKIIINFPKGTNGAYVDEISYYPEAKMLLDERQKMNTTEASED